MAYSGDLDFVSSENGTTFVFCFEMEVDED